MSSDAFRAFLAALVASAVGAACAGSSSTGGTDSNTHWFSLCESDAECGALSCLCGVCSRPCSESGDCNGLGAPAECTTPQTCASGEEQTVCSPARTCETTAEARKVGACIVGSAIVDETQPNQGSPVYVLRGQGTVLEEGTGPAPNDCFSRYETAIGTHFEAGAPELDDARWIRVEWEDGSEVIVGAVGVSIVGLGTPEGLALIDYRHRPGERGPSDSHLEIQYPLRIHFWMGDAGTVAELDAPAELAFEEGAATCTHRSECIDEWTLNDLQVTSGGETVTIPHGSGAPVGSFQVTNAALQVQTGATLCPGTSAAKVTVTAERLLLF